MQKFIYCQNKQTNALRMLFCAVLFVLCCVAIAIPIAVSAYANDESESVEAESANQEFAEEQATPENFIDSDDADNTMGGGSNFNYSDNENPKILLHALNDNCFKYQLNQSIPTIEHSDGLTVTSNYARGITTTITFNESDLSSIKCKYDFSAQVDDINPYNINLNYSLIFTTSNNETEWVTYENSITLSDTGKSFDYDITTDVIGLKDGLSEFFTDKEIEIFGYNQIDIYTKYDTINTYSVFADNSYNDNNVKGDVKVDRQRKLTEDEGWNTQPIGTTEEDSWLSFTNDSSETTNGWSEWSYRWDTTKNTITLERWLEDSQVRYDRYVLSPGCSDNSVVFAGWKCKVNSDWAPVDQSDAGKRLDDLVLEQNEWTQLKVNADFYAYFVSAKDLQVQVKTSDETTEAAVKDSNVKYSISRNDGEQSSFFVNETGNIPFEFDKFVMKGVTDDDGIANLKVPNCEKIWNYDNYEKVLSAEVPDSLIERGYMYTPVTMTKNKVDSGQAKVLLTKGALCKVPAKEATPGHKDFTLEIYQNGALIDGPRNVDRIVTGLDNSGTAELTPMFKNGKLCLYYTNIYNDEEGQEITIESYWYPNGQDYNKIAAFVDSAGNKFPLNQGISISEDEIDIDLVYQGCANVTFVVENDILSCTYYNGESSHEAYDLTQTTTDQLYEGTTMSVEEEALNFDYQASQATYEEMTQSGTVVAVPAEGYSFESWSIDGQPIVDGTQLETGKDYTVKAVLVKNEEVVPSSTAAQTGDYTLYVFALLSVLAIAGSSVVAIRKRNTN